MATQLEFVASPQDVLDSLLRFNRDAPRYLELAWDLIRRTQYWVYDVPSEAFGPGKFVGMKGMDYDLYQQAREGRTFGARFDGHFTRRAIADSCGPFGADASLHQELSRWAEALVGPQVFAGVDPSKWQFVQLRPAEKSDTDMTEWSDWAFLDEAPLPSVPAKPGAYIVRAVIDRKGDRPHVIRRCVGEDDEGVLVIGESRSLRTRLRDLRGAMRDLDRGGHMAGWRYAFLEMKKIFPLELLQFRYLTVATKEEAYRLEGKLLHDYARRHYELPPLNYKSNWSEDEA